MDHAELNKDKLIKFWIDGSDDDFETMIAMFNTKRLSWSLFIGHLMIEKLLKAYLDLTHDKKEQLVTITAFNISARYDDYKMSFKKQCTPEYTSEWVDKLKELRSWIKTLILQ